MPLLRQGTTRRMRDEHMQALAVRPSRPARRRETRFQRVRLEGRSAKCSQSWVGTLPGDQEQVAWPVFHPTCSRFETLLRWSYPETPGAFRAAGLCRQRSSG